MRKLFALIGLISSLLASAEGPLYQNDSNPKPFSCDEQSFVSFNTSESGPKEGDSDFDIIKLSDGSLGAHKVIDGVNGVNSIGYNVVDNYIWGYNLKLDKLVRIDANEKVQLFDLPEGLPSGGYIAADVDANGVLYLAERGASEIQRVNVNPKSSHYLEALEPLQLTNNLTISTADFAFNPKDGKLYYIQEESNGKVYRIDPSTGDREFVVESGVDPYVVITFFDRDGNFYFNLGTGSADKNKLYKINMNDPKPAEYFTDLDKGLTNGDGARCANAPVTKKIKQPQPFSCETAGAIVSYSTTHSASTGNTNLNFYRLFDGNLTQKYTYPDNTLEGVNSIGYNVKDNLIWGYNIPTRKIVSIDANHSYRFYEMDNVPDIDGHYYNAADVSPNGVLYMKSDTRESRLDRVELDYNKSTLHVLNSIQLSEPMKADDFAFNPKDGKIYYIDYNENKLKRIDIIGTTGKVVAVSEYNDKFDYPIVSFFDKDGNFYFNAGQEIRKVTFDDQGKVASVTHFSNVQDMTQGDGARCANASIGLPTSPPEPAKLLADYHFDACDYNGTDGEVKDSIGNNNGTTIGNVKTIEGVVSRAAYFHGNDENSPESIEVDSPNFDLSDNFSIAFWVKIDGKGAVLSKRIDVVANADKTLNIFLNNGQSVKTSTLSGWTYVVLVKADRKFRVYLNGSLDREIDTGTITSQHEEVAMGYKKYQSTDINKRDVSTSFTGGLDELKFYKGILSTDDIHSIYLNENSGKNWDGSDREKPECLVPFACDYNSYIFTSNLDANYSEAILVNIADETTSVAKDAFNNAHINAIGFNPVDNFIYGWSYGKGGPQKDYSDAHVIKVDANYTVSRVELDESIVSLPKREMYLGDVSKNGIFYLAYMENDSRLEKIYAVDLNRSKVLGVIHLQYPSDDDTDIRSADFAISPIDDNLYMINANNGQLLRINLHGAKKGLVEELGNNGTTAGSNGNNIVANFFDRDGNFYFEVNSQAIYRINIAHPWSGKNDKKAHATFFSDVSISSGDGARCSLAPISDKVFLHLSQQKVNILETNTTTPNLSDGTNGREIMVTINASKKLKRDVHVIIGQVPDKGSATPNLDYIGREPISVIFPAGATQYTFKSSDIFDDTEIEQDENFFYAFGVDINDKDIARFKDGSIEQLEVLIKDDDTADFTAFDPDESDPDLTKRKIKTKVVDENFTLTLASLNPFNEQDFNTSTTVVRFIDGDLDQCKDTYENVNAAKYDFFHRPNYGGFKAFEIGDGNLSTTHRFNVMKASPDLKAQFLWKDNKLGLWHTSCSTDHFAVRPKSFSFGMGSGSALRAKSGESYHLHIVAQNANNTPSLAYNEVKDRSFMIDVNQTNIDCNFTSSDIDDSNLTAFINGDLNGTIKYDDVGKITLSVHEINGSEFAFVDRNDTPDADRFISEVNKTIEFVPYAYDMDVSYDNPHIFGSSDYAFYSNDINSSPAWKITVKAVNKDGNVVENFDKECSAKDVLLSVDLNIIGSASKIISSVDDNVTERDVSSQMHIPDTIAKDGFVKGKADSTIKINFGRPWTPINPSKLVIDKITASDLSGVSDGNKTGIAPTGGLIYEYMRAYVQSPVSVVGTKRLNVPFYYEAYEDGTASVHLVSPGSQSISGDQNWYQVSRSDDGSANKMKIISAIAVYPSRVTVTNMGNTALEVNATDLPERNRIFITVEPEFATTASHKISTDVNFIPDSVNWSGKGKTGRVVDTNISQGTRFKKLEW